MVDPGLTYIYVLGQSYNRYMAETQNEGRCGYLHPRSSKRQGGLHQAYARGWPRHACEANHPPHRPTEANCTGCTLPWSGSCSPCYQSSSNNRHP